MKKLLIAAFVFAGLAFADPMYSRGQSFTYNGVTYRVEEVQTQGIYYFCLYFDSGGLMHHASVLISDVG